MWNWAKLLVWLALLAYGLANMPAAVKGIPFVQVLPALLLAGAGVLMIEVVQLSVHRESQRSKSAAVLLALLAVVVIGTVHNLLYRLDVVSDDAETHYNKLTESEE